eukprot:GHVU01155738.1.p1 GENE.GHVU01155738.1~~GHVU01155738.1.p1  ORF type:complete len:212 (+),score=21.46 GHVU01155738.1:210-845(+)
MTTFVKPAGDSLLDKALLGYSGWMLSVLRERAGQAHDEYFDEMLTLLRHTTGQEPRTLDYAKIFDCTIKHEKVVFEYLDQAVKESKVTLSITTADNTTKQVEKSAPEARRDVEEYITILSLIASFLDEETARDERISELGNILAGRTDFPDFRIRLNAVEGRTQVHRHDLSLGVRVGNPMNIMDLEPLLLDIANSDLFKVCQSPSCRLAVG